MPGKQPKRGHAATVRRQKTLCPDARVAGPNSTAPSSAATGAWRSEFNVLHDLPHQIDRLRPFVDAFAYHYNHHGPHDALNGRTRAEYLNPRQRTPPPSHMSRTRKLA